MKFLAFIKRSAVNARGNVAMIVALCTPVLVGIVGFATDYGYATYINQGLQSAADAAVLAATSQSAATSGGGYSNTSWLTSYGADVFKGDIAKLPAPANTVTPNFTVVSNGTGGVIATASYTYAVPTFISGIIGMPTITVSGNAKATANPLTYINYYILVDASQSMGIADSPTDMDTLYNLVANKNNGSNGEVGCTFACHVQTGAQTDTNENIAHNAGVQLRIDSAVSAIQNIIGLAGSAAGSNKNIAIGLYTMNEDPTGGLDVRQISAPSTDYYNLPKIAKTIDLGNNVANGVGDSNFTTQLKNFNKNFLGPQGSGASAVSPINYVFIITDGLSDTPNTATSNCTSGHCTGTVATSDCDVLKSKATVGVIYTTYYPIYEYTKIGSIYYSDTPANKAIIQSQYPNQAAPIYQQNYLDLVYPYATQIGPALQSCASPGYYYTAGNGAEITSGMQALFASSLQTARLTH